MNGGLKRALSSLGRDRRGVAALEFAVIGGIMVTLALGAFDFGNAAQQQIALQQALRSGGEYARDFPAASASTIQAVVSSAASTARLALRATPTVACSCNGTGYTCGSPPSSCPSPVTVSIGAAASPLSIGPLAALIPNITANYVVRIQ